MIKEIDTMNMKLVQEVTASQIRHDLPEIQIGDTVIVGVSITEGNKTRIQDYQGLVIAKRGEGVSKSFTVNFTAVFAVPHAGYIYSYCFKETSK